MKKIILLMILLVTPFIVKAETDIKEENTHTEYIELRVNSKSDKLYTYFEDLSSIDKIEWTIENPEILEIKDNTIVAKKIGNTKVTATVLGISYTINVKVTDLSIIENPLTTTSVTIITYIIMFASGLYLLFVAMKLKKI